MKKIIYGFFIIGLITAFCGSVPVIAADEKEASPEDKPAAVPSKALQAKSKKIEERKKELDNTEWEITLGSADKKTKGEKDKLIFRNKMISLESFAKEGFGPTNYTITVSEDLETATFETMQSAKAGNIFIRGDWTKDIMQGNINQQFDGGKKTREYYFTSAPVKKIVPLSEADKEAQSQSVSSEPKASEGPMVALESTKK